MTPPHLTGNDNPITYTYNNLGQTTQAADATSGHTVSFTYDALGRTASEVFPWRTKTMGYDAAGRLTSLNYGDGFYVTYTYDNVGEMTAVYENGGTWLASWGYDDLGRRIWSARANGVSTGWTINNGDQLTYLTHDLPGTGSDVTLGFTYNHARQITQRTSSNDAYAWTDSFNVNRSYTSNGLNQYTAISTITPTYDGRGNLTSAGGQSYAYTARNQLEYASGGSALFYDALGRLDYDAIGTPNCAALDNVGSNIDAELNCSTGATLRRYVYGPDNAPVVWYEGSGTSDKRWLLTDERGSVIAVTDNSGSATRINSYDEYGIPGSNNLGRFGYTGQPWLTSLGMYHYRARTYSPTLGRFMQTDPIGYGDGPNWYNYTHNDPVNGVDPSGTDCNTAEGCNNFAEDTRNSDGSEATVTVIGLPFRAANSVSGGASGGFVGRQPDGGSNSKEKNGDKTDTCAAVALQGGQINYTGISTTAILGAGLTRTSGTFTNIHTGSSGHFVSYGVGVGLNIGAGQTTGSYRSMGDFLGYSETIEADLSLPLSFSINGFRTENVNNELTAQGGGWSIGPNLHLPSALTRVVISTTASDTSISDCTLGPRS